MVRGYEAINDEDSIMEVRTEHVQAEYPLTHVLGIGLGEMYGRNFQPVVQEPFKPRYAPGAQKARPDGILQSSKYCFRPHARINTMMY